MVQPSDANDQIVEAELDEEEYAERLLSYRADVAEKQLQSWLCRKSWSAAEASYLLSGLKPDGWHAVMGPERNQLLCYLPELCHCLGVEESNAKIFNGGTYIEVLDESKTKISRVLDFAERFTCLEGEPYVRPPKKWLELAAENEHRVPWLEFASSRPGLKKYLLVAEKEQNFQHRIDALEAENKQLRAELEKSRPLAQKERTSMLKIIAGMAMGGYDWDLRTWRPDKYKRIWGDLERSGVRLADNTVRKYFDEARNVIGDP